MASNQGGQSKGGLGVIGDQLSSAAGGSGDNTSGGDQSYLSKGIETLQQSVFGKRDESKSGAGAEQGDRSHHKEVDQAHPEKISEFLRDEHMSTTREERKGPRLG